MTPSAELEQQGVHIPRSSGRWLGPVPFPHSIGKHVLAIGHELADRLGPWPVWWVVGIVCGIVPLAVDFALSTRTQAAVTGLLVTPLLVAAISRNLPWRGMSTITIVFFSHSLFAIWLAYHHPERLAIVLPEGEAFWHRSWDWIATGICQEYDLSWWLPGHIQLLAAVIVLNYATLGMATLCQGIHEIDLMNFYVGRLLAHAEQPTLALMLGWHPWSVCRGIGYLLLTYEIASLSLSRLSGTPLASLQARQWRWGLGLGFLVLDGIIKYTLLEAVRRVLAECLGSN